MQGTVTIRFAPKRLAIVVLVAAVIALAAMMAWSSMRTPQLNAAQLSGLASALAQSSDSQDDVTPEQSQTAAVDYFLKLDGIEGESIDERHKNEIDVLSWSWGESNNARAASGRGGAGAGKVSMQDFHFTAQSSKASPKLMLACATGQHIKEAKLTARKAGGDQQEYLIITLKDVVISSYQIGGSGGSAPVDQFSINFAQIEFEYKPQNPDGSLGDPVRAGWDVRTNRAL
jgi:type VI secretion system secreted protein Hcp